MKPLNRGSLRSPKKDRTHPDYKSSMMLSSGEIRVRPKRRACEPMKVYARMADGSFQALSDWTSPVQANEHARACMGTRKERRAARDEARQRTGSVLASGVSRRDLPEKKEMPVARAIPQAEWLNTRG